MTSVMRWGKWGVVICLVVQTVARAATAGETAVLPGAISVISWTKHSGAGLPKARRRERVPALDRVAFAVDGIESSHGTNQAMWRSNWLGPQGPMQVSEGAAIDVGGGDRFDPLQNRLIGRAYLAALYTRYKDWPDAIAAYNWGLGNVDTWIKAGRPSEKLVTGVASYTVRVLRDSGVCDDAVSAAQPSSSMLAPLNTDDTASARSRGSGCVSVVSNTIKVKPLRPTYSLGSSSSPFARQAAVARSSWEMATRRLGCVIGINGSLRCK
jgi:hypothetical protein